MDTLQLDTLARLEIFGVITLATVAAFFWWRNRQARADLAARAVADAYETGAWRDYEPAGGIGGIR